MRRRRILRAIETFEKWAREDEMKGCGDPADHNRIEGYFKKAKQHLIKVIFETTEA